MDFKNRLKILPLLLCLISCQRALFKKEIPLILDVVNVDAENIYYTDRFAGFGKGYTFEVYTLSDNTIKEFEDKTSKTLPQRKDHIWEKQRWTSTKPDTSYNYIFEMALNYDDGDKDLENKIEIVKKSLTKKEVYYSFYYRPDKQNTREVELYVLDVKLKTLYMIKSDI